MIAQGEGEDCYPQTTAGWGEDTLVMVQAPCLRRFSRYWDRMGNASYHVEEYNLETKTKTTYTVTPDKTGAENPAPVSCFEALHSNDFRTPIYKMRKVGL